MGLFEGMQNAKITEQGNYLKDGEYDLEVDFVQVKKTRKSGDGFIVDFKVLASSNPEIPVGSKRNWFQSLRDTDIAYAAILEFAIALCGYSLKKKDDEAKIQELRANSVQIMNEACDKDKQAMKGMRVHCTVETIKTKERGLPFSRHKFTPIEAA